ncbi:phasin-related domain-containing protein [Paenibacillus terrigena]|uniref:phasin family protein n=1 Tax=Paenibacillus terrigena TaxID=369333 RepID=UPI0028D0E5C9|nr:hypothetical protein [Paenibacillus terrigena]
MKDLLNRSLSLGIGIIAQSKEQIEKTVEELVNRGELTRKESAEWVDELVKKGEEARLKIESNVMERVQRTMGEQQTRGVSREEFDELSQRLARLEQRLGENQ